MRQFIVLTLCCIVLGVNAKETRLTNNDLAMAGEFPYQVSLQLDGRHFCGGSLISKQHVLTAAHCVDDLVKNRVAKYRINAAVGTTTTTGGVRIGVERVSHHGLYNARTLDHDIAVIKLNRPITESAYARPIALPSSMQEHSAGTPLSVSGFGTNRLMGPVSPVLKKMNMVVVSQGTCQQQWPGMRIGTGQMCATLAPGYGVCQGDSGGPLTLSNKQVVVGVVSATSSMGCGTGIPDLFTKVSHYISYIQSEMAY